MSLNQYTGTSRGFSNQSLVNGMGQVKREGRLAGVALAAGRGLLNSSAARQSCSEALWQTYGCSSRWVRMRLVAQEASHRLTGRVHWPQPDLKHRAAMGYSVGGIEAGQSR
jgi:hypothetical protein